jgi:hypothetical protein
MSSVDPMPDKLAQCEWEKFLTYFGSKPFRMAKRSVGRGAATALGANAAERQGTRRDYFGWSKALQGHPAAPEISPCPTAKPSPEEEPQDRIHAANLLPKRRISSSKRSS